MNAARDVTDAGEVRIDDSGIFVAFDEFGRGKFVRHLCATGAEAHSCVSLFSAGLQARCPGQKSGASTKDRKRNG